MQKVLIVDDEEDILEPIALLLEIEGFTVVTRSDGTQTFSTIASFSPDILLLDILMSGTDGRAICQQLKAQAQTRHLPVILMSARPGADKDAIDAGADDFLAKPFETESLLKKIQQHTRGKN